MEEKAGWRYPRPPSSLKEAWQGSTGARVSSQRSPWLGSGNLSASVSLQLSHWLGEALGSTSSAPMPLNTAERPSVSYSP